MDEDMTAIPNSKPDPASGSEAAEPEEAVIAPLPDVASALRPALFSAYRDLAELRYDFPLLLADAVTADRSGVRTLRQIFDDIIAVLAPAGRGGERRRSHVLRLDAELRRMLGAGQQGRLTELWQTAADKVVSRAAKSERAELSETLGQARAVLATDGELVACDADLPSAFMSHVWSRVHAAERQHFTAMIDDLTRWLSDILKADFTKSDEARSAWNVERAVGPTFGQVFDFEAMSRLLKDAPAHERLSVARKERIGSVIATLRSQRFFAAGDADEQAEPPHSFVFDSCESALRAFHDHLPEMIELIKAIAIAWLEIDNRYRESEHDAVFARLGENGIDAGDLELFPSYLVRLDAGANEAREKAAIFECLASNVPFKILAQSDDLFAAPAIAGGSHLCSVQALPLAQMALGLSETFVMQTSASHLNRMRVSVVAGMESSRPALFSVYSGAATPDSAGRYLDAAAAVESRAFPVFTFDPAAGQDWAARFSLDGNPQAETDWPAHDFRFEDESLQRQSEAISFSFADFAARHHNEPEFFKVVRRADWHDDMRPLGDCLAENKTLTLELTPYILMVDDDDRLYRVIVERPVVEAVLRCRDAWRSLQELGGINNSHAREAVALEKAAWQAAQEQKAAAAVAAAPTAPAVAAPAGEAPAAAPADDGEAAPVDYGDDPYIETPRCTTCNECTAINARMFVYDDNMQAYIADPDAGTYRQLVEAAETCQVCIIHPGQPRNADEHGLEELIERASEFN